MRIKILLWILLLFIIIGSASAAIKTMQDVNEKKVYTADDASYEITATYINDGKVKFDVNNEETDLLGYHDIYKFEDGSIVFVREILEEEVLEGDDKVIFNFYPAKCSDCKFEIVDTEETTTEEEIAENTEETAEETAEDAEETTEETTIEEGAAEKTAGEPEEKTGDSEETDNTTEESENKGETAEGAKEKGFLGRFFDWFAGWLIWWHK